MRLLFKKGKQRELIKRFKENNKLSWKQLSKILNSKESKLKTYYYEASLVPDSIYKRLDKNKEFKKYIIQKYQNNWGQSKGGTISLGNTKEINFPKESKEFAEFYGIMLGDGNSNKTKAYKIGTYSIRIVGDSRYDQDYLINYVKPLIESLFNIRVRIGKFKNQNACFIEAHSSQLVNFLENKGFKPGNKIKNQLEIPLWIKQNSSFLKVCLRGLYDTDGSIYKLTNQNSYQINFCNKNPVLMEDVRNSLINLRIFPSKISKEKDLYITKKEEITKFLKLIEFRNSKHFNKVKMWNL